MESFLAVKFVILSRFLNISDSSDSGCNLSFGDVITSSFGSVIFQIYLMAIKCDV